jgi:hypothetical protein
VSDVDLCPWIVGELVEHGTVDGEFSWLVLPDIATLTVVAAMVGTDVLSLG